MPARIVLATRNMTAKRRRAAALDRAHRFHLVEADVTAVGAAPCRSVIAEDIRDLQSWPGHGGSELRLRCLLQSDPVERAHDIADGGRRNARVVRRHVELGMAEQRLDDAYIYIALQ